MAALAEGLVDTFAFAYDGEALCRIEWEWAMLPSVGVHFRHPPASMTHPFLPLCSDIPLHWGV